jgi:hypothetical protein
MVGLLLNRRVAIPTEFSAQCQAVKTIYDSDASGLVDSISDKMVENASTRFYFESLKNYSGFEALLNEWCERINEDYRAYGLPVGVSGLQEQYYKERWKYSSFPIIRYGDWKKIGSGNNTLEVPMSIIVLDGCAIRAKEKKETKGDVLGLFPYDFFLGDDENYRITADKHLITRPYGRAFDSLPKPFIMRRGIYQNWKLIYDLTNKQDELLSKVIPYYLLLKRGIGSKNVDESNLEKTVLKLQEAIDKIPFTEKVPVHASNSDSSLEHLIPNMENMFKQQLFSHSEKAIIAGFGLIDIYDSGVASRKESVLNPKGFMSELFKGQKDFKAIMMNLLSIIKAKNASKLKYTNEKIITQIIPPRDYFTKEIKEDLHKAHGRGNISEKTYNELVVCPWTDEPIELEVKRSKYEAAEGICEDLYARVIQNTEQNVGFDIPQIESNTSDDKKQGNLTAEKFTVATKQNMNMGLYSEDKYPKYLQDFPSKARNAWIRTWNAVYKKDGSETKASKIAWKALRLKMKQLRNANEISRKDYKKLTIASKITQEVVNES